MRRAIIRGLSLGVLTFVLTVIVEALWFGAWFVSHWTLSKDATLPGNIDLNFWWWMCGLPAMLFGVVVMAVVWPDRPKEA